MYVCTYICVCILKFEITPNTTSKLLVDWMFIDDICEHDRLVSAFDCLLQDDSKPQYGGGILTFNGLVNDVDNSVVNAWKTTVLKITLWKYRQVWGDKC